MDDNNEFLPFDGKFIEVTMNLLTCCGIPLKRKLSTNLLFYYMCIFATPRYSPQSTDTQRKEVHRCNIICLWWWIPIGVPWDIQPVLTNQHIFHSQSTFFPPLFFFSPLYLPFFFLNQMIFHALLPLTFSPRMVLMAAGMNLVIKRKNLMSVGSDFSGTSCAALSSLSAGDRQVACWWLLCILCHRSLPF